MTTATQPLVARTQPNIDFKVGDQVYFRPQLDKARYFDKETEICIQNE
jgi:multiple sugar transport system ATP-binding protein